ncbi:restriction endonuclease subunit S [Paenibacillus sp. FSL H8-0122]|uniref:restriction endonuclease subunit S n=1 Tax=Paenibacillus sp. FSL H8-0122 TaxID=2954510 RepID=UPI0030FBF30F
MNAQDLKNSILQLAIQGKLVEQREEEGTAKELLKQINAEKEQLIKRGKPIPGITENDIPFDIPESWEWVRLGEVILLTSGQDMTPNNYKDTKVGVPYLTGASNIVDGRLVINRWTNEPKSIALKGDLLLTCKGTVGTTTILQEEEVHIARQIMSLRTFIMDIEYIHIFIKSYVNTLKAKAKSMIPGIERKNVLEAVIPIPPLEEQKRIVAKIEALMPYVEKYGEAHSKLEVFNKKFPEDMQKSILQYAIQGKLVEQREEEGTAEALYQHIQEEKVKLIKENKIKKEKPLPVITEDEIPFEIPESWKWVRLQQIGELSRGKSKHRPRNDVKIFENGTFPMIQTGDVARADEIITQYTTMYNELGVAQSRVWQKGTVCLTIAANIGDVAILGFDACFPDSVVGFNAYHPIDTNMYFLYVLMCYKDILDKMSRSTAQKNINIEILSKVAFPLPPLAEQKRIVEKIKEMMPYCKQVNK